MTFKDELEYKHEIMSLLKGRRWSVQAHEDKISNYIPDLSFGFQRVDGWIEVKYLPRVPKSLAAIPHYTYGQQEWLINRGAKGSGHCYLWVGTPNAHYLWRWSSLAEARVMPWAKAAGLALVEEDLGGLCRAISAVVRPGPSY